MRFLATCLVLVLVACESTAPTTGVTVYEHSDFRGKSRNLTDDVENFALLGNPPDCGDALTLGWHDCVSSIRVAEGWEAIVYEHDTFRGDSLVIMFDIPDLGRVGRTCDDRFDAPGWDECISSIRVKRSR